MKKQPEVPQTKPKATLLWKLLEETDEELSEKRVLRALKNRVHRIWSKSPYQEIQVEHEGYKVSLLHPVFFSDPSTYQRSRSTFHQQEDREVVFIVAPTTRTLANGNESLEDGIVKDKSTQIEVLKSLLGDAPS